MGILKPEPITCMPIAARSVIYGQHVDMQRSLQQLLSLRALLCGAAQPLGEGVLYGQALQQLRGLKKQANEVRR